MVNTSTLKFCLSRDNPGIMLFLRTRQFAPLHCTSTGVFVSPMGTVNSFYSGHCRAMSYSL